MHSTGYVNINEYISPDGPQLPSSIVPLHEVHANLILQLPGSVC